MGCIKSVHLACCFSHVILVGVVADQPVENHKLQCLTKSGDGCWEQAPPLAADEVAIHGGEFKEKRSTGWSYTGKAFPSRVQDFDLDYFTQDADGFFSCPRFDAEFSAQILANLSMHNIPAVFPGYAREWMPSLDKKRLADELARLGEMHIQLAPGGVANQMRQLRDEPVFIVPAILSTSDSGTVPDFFASVAEGASGPSLRAVPLNALDHGGAGAIVLNASVLNDSDFHLYVYGNLRDDVLPEVTYPPLSEAGWELHTRAFFLLSNRYRSGLHLDQFENVFANLQGEKTFYMFPSHEIGNLYVGQARGDPTALRWAFSANGSLGLYRSHAPSGSPYSFVPNVEERLRSGAAPEHRFPRLRNVRVKFCCRVKAGDVLFLPAGWLHDVHTSAPPGEFGLAVNNWLRPPSSISADYFQWRHRLEHASTYITEQAERSMRRGEAALRSRYVNFQVGDHVHSEADGSYKFSTLFNGNPPRQQGSTV